MLILLNDSYCSCMLGLIGYEPADLTVHPPPPKKNDRGWIYFFRIGV